MKQIITLAFAGSISLINAQTPLIAHKSHAGTNSSFLIDPSSNFGRMEPAPDFSVPISTKTETFKPLNDSVMVVETIDLIQKVIKIDTLPNHQRYSRERFEYEYRNSIREKEYQEKQYQLKMEEEKQLKDQQNQQLNESTPTKKKKKSYLLFLFGITGGGMLLMKLFSRSKITQQSII